MRKMHWIRGSNGYTLWSNGNYQYEITKIKDGRIVTVKSLNDTEFQQAVNAFEQIVADRR